MKKLAIAFILSPFFSISQVTDSVKPKNKKIDIGITFSPDYSYRRLKSDVENRFVADVLDTVELAKFGFTTGLNAIYRFNAKLSISIGLLFADKGERLKNGSIPTIVGYTNHYYYLDIPFKVNYNLTDKKNILYVTAGFSGNLFLNARSTYKYESSIDKIVQKNDFDVEKMTFSMNAGLGINCPMNKTSFFKIETLYRESITPIINNAPIKRNLFSIGINLGFYHCF